jgi:hypothetical protein
MEKRKLPDWIGAYLEYVDNSEPPENYKRWVGLSVIAACLQRKCVLQWGLDSIYPNLYVVLVGPAGCRKGTAMGPGKGLLNSLGINIAADSITREALIRDLKTIANFVTMPDGTMALHSSLTVYSPELSVFIGHNNPALMTALIDWFDSASRWTYKTKNMGNDEIVGVWVNLLGATTPEMLQTVFPRDAVGSGLTSRIIFVVEDKKGKVCPAPFLTQRQKALRVLLEDDLRQIFQMAGEFTMTEECFDLYVEWYSGVGQKPPFNAANFSSYFDRRSLHIRKLAMICSASRDNNMVLEAQDMERALNLLQEVEKKMPHAFGGMGKFRDSDVLFNIKRFIKERRHCTYAEIINEFQKEVSFAGMNDILNSLASSNYLHRHLDAHHVMHLNYNPEGDPET